MRRIASRAQKRSVRALVRVEFLEDRRLLTASALPTNSSWSQSAVPLSVSRPVAAPAASLTMTGSGSAIGYLAGSAAPGPYTPAQIRHAYGVDQLTNLDGTGQTIAIVDAYLDTTIVNDLAVFDARFGLPAANLVVATPQASQGTMTSDSGWALETALDVEWAHAIAPGAKILLVEAFSSNDTDLLNAVSYAVAQGATQVSMSWGGGEYSGEGSLDSYFETPGVTFLASSGDTGGEMLFPAISPYVTSVGGTTISLDSAGNRLSESAWSAGGGGQSAYNTEPSYQKGFQSTGFRTTPDVSYDADPNSGVYVYDAGNWYGVGGTSAGSPQWAGLISLINQGLASAGKPSLGKGQTYGTNSVLYQVAGGTSYTNKNGDFLDITTGSNTHAAGTGYDQATGLGVPVSTKLIPDLIGPAIPTVPTVGDLGFESVSVANGFVYNPAGSAWTFSGSPGNGSGLSGNNSAFTSGNPAAPQGNQVAFIQDTGSISQSISGWAAGTYSITFDAAQRGNYGTSNEDFQVLIDGAFVGTFKPTGTSYQIYTTAPFTVGAGSHVLSFVGLDTVGGDNTVFLDSVSVAVASIPTTPTLGDSGFESVSVANGFTYNPAGSAWTFSGGPGNGSGLSGNNSAFTSGNPAAPQGTQVAFIQDTGTITQSIAGWAAGTYTLAFSAAQRGNYGTSNEDFQVLIDGVVVSVFKPTGTSYQTYTSAPFTVGAGSHVLSFVGLDTVGGDNTVFLDNVSVAIATTPTIPTLGDPGFESVYLGNGGFSYAPTGSAWTFLGSSGNGAGVSGNNSAFTYGSPAAPQGTQVAFIQDTGSFSQSITGWNAGNYTIAFSAAQRGNYGTSNEDFQVLIDGVVVSTFKPTGTSYQTYTTTSFTVGAGSHVLSFVGLDTVGGDNTVFLDNVSIAKA